jgi:hypothetical protein
VALELELSWPNPAHELLQRPEIDVVPEWPGGAPPGGVVVTKRKPGLFRVQVPGDPARLTLNLSFEVSLGSRTIGRRAFSNEPVPELSFGTTTASTVSATVLEMSQPYEVANGKLIALARRAYGGAPHPLLTAPRPPGPDGVFPIGIATDFVDVTSLWMNRAMDAYRYTMFETKGMKLVVLGLTRPSGPLLWFALVPGSFPMRAGALSSLVFYRPTSPYRYTSIDQANHDMYPLNRYLLWPTEKAKAPECWVFDRFFPYRERNVKQAKLYGDVCAGFARSILRGGKPLVLLYPFPSGQDYGAAATADVADLAGRALRFLWAGERIGKDRPRVTLGRFGLAAFSAGGGQMLNALNANPKAVKEVFAFDCEGMPTFKPSLRKWMKTADDNMLRLTGAYAANVKANVELRDELVDQDKVDAERVSAVPKDATTSWEKGGNPWWDHVLSFLETLDPAEATKARAQATSRHQFAVFGGDDPNRKQTYLAKFLALSQF